MPCTVYNDFLTYLALQDAKKNATTRAPEHAAPNKNYADAQVSPQGDFAFRERLGC